MTGLLFLNNHIFITKLNAIMNFGDRLKKIIVNVLTPLTYLRYTNNYKGGFMTYSLSPKASQYVRSALVDGVDNLVLANQWLVLPGGTPIAVVSGKFAIQHILNLDGLDYNIDK